MHNVQKHTLFFSFVPNPTLPFAIILTFMYTHIYNCIHYICFIYFRTDNRHNKVVYFKEIGLWYVNEQPTCNMGSKMLVHALEKKNQWYARDHGAGSPESIRNLCCMRDAYWKDNVEMKPVVVTATTK